MMNTSTPPRFAHFLKEKTNGLLQESYGPKYLRCGSLVHSCAAEASELPKSYTSLSKWCTWMMTVSLACVRKLQPACKVEYDAMGD